MVKRRTHDSQDNFDANDDPIGLTSAFKPLSSEPDRYDDPVGLTQAFGAVDEESQQKQWNTSDKWKGFDWNAPIADGTDVVEQDAADAASVADAAGTVDAADAVSGADAASVADAANQGDEQASVALDTANTADGAGAADVVNQSAAQASSREQNATERSNETDPESHAASHAGAHAETKTASCKEASPSKKKSTGPRHVAPEPELSPRMQKSRKTRRRLVVVIVLLLIIMAAVGVGGYRILTGVFPFMDTPQSQPPIETSADADVRSIVSDQDTQQAVGQTTEVPELASLLGKTQDDAVQAIGHGALATSTRDVTEKGSSIKKSVTVELTDEPGSPRSGGTPKVYLGLNKRGKVIQVGYSAPVGLLGYGTMNFQDAVTQEHIIEKTLARIGVPVEDGSASLPDDKAEYTTYDKDGTTAVKERYAFDGDTEIDGKACAWSAVLSYDYTSANISGNASETVRLIYVYLTQK